MTYMQTNPRSIIVNGPDILFIRFIRPPPAVFLHTFTIITAGIGGGGGGAFKLLSLFVECL